MYAEKTLDSVHNLYSAGQPAEMGFRYISDKYAGCPVCGGDAFITRQEHGPKAIFRCSSCFHQFERDGKMALWV